MQHQSAGAILSAQRRGGINLPEKKRAYAPLLSATLAIGRHRQSEKNAFLRAGRAGTQACPYYFRSLAGLIGAGDRAERLTDGSRPAGVDILLPESCALYCWSFISEGFFGDGSLWAGTLQIWHVWKEWHRVTVLGSTGPNDNKMMWSYFVGE